MSDEVKEAVKSTTENTGKSGLKPPWQKGQTGNPHGRPKNAYSLTAMLRERGEEMREDGRTWAQALSEKMWQIAVEEGDRAFGIYIVDRLDGKPKERIEHSESHIAQIMLVTDDGSQGAAETTAVPSNES